MTFLPAMPMMGFQKARFDFDFTTLSLGKVSQSSLLSTTAVGNVCGVKFSHASVCTVQTSATTVDDTPGVNDAPIGCRSSSQASRGLVMGPRCQLLLSGSMFPCTKVGWSAGETNGSNGWTGASSTATDGVGAPTGGSDAVHITTDHALRGLPAYSPAAMDGSYGIYCGGGVAAPTCMSAWVNGATQFESNQGGNPTDHPPGRTMTLARVKYFSAAGWQRCVFIDDVERYANITFADGRDFDGFDPEPGEGGPFAISADFWAMNLTRGKYVWEAIKLTGGIDAARDLFFETGDDAVAEDGQIKIRVVFSPLVSTADAIYFGTSTTTAAGRAFFGYTVSGVNSYAYIRASDNRLVVKIGSMTEVVSSNAMSAGLLSYVVVELFVGNNLPSVARYSVNGGAWNDFGLSTISNAPNPGSNPVYFLSAPFDSGDALDRYGWPAYLHRLTVF